MANWKLRREIDFYTFQNNTDPSGRNPDTS
jgi:hypothetical protein